MVYGEPIHKMSALAAPVGGTALMNLNVQGMQHPRSLGVASIRAPWRKAIVGVETRWSCHPECNAPPTRLRDDLSPITPHMC
jgi:hypothetical protein